MRNQNYLGSLGILSLHAESLGTVPRWGVAVVFVVVVVVAVAVAVAVCWQ